MVSRYFGIVAVAAFVLQSGVQAEAACQTVNGAICGGGGKGSIASVSGNVSLAQGGGISRAAVGSSISAGSRVLAGDTGSAQLNLGAGCFTSVTPNSVATLTSQNGLTCLRQNDAFTAQTPPNNGSGDNNNGLAGGLLVLGVIGGAVGLGLGNGTGTSGLSP